MQVLVLYYSKSGNARKLAEYIAQGVDSVKGVRTMLKSTKYVTKDDFVDSLGIIAGSPASCGSMAWDLNRVFDETEGIRKHMKDKVGAAFATSPDSSSGNDTTIMSVLQVFLGYGMILVGDSSNVIGNYGVSCVGEPDEKVVGYAKKLGRRVAELCEKLQK